MKEIIAKKRDHSHLEIAKSYRAKRVGHAKKKNM